MRPARKGDGTGLSVPGFSEIRKGDGTVVYSAAPAIPDSGLYRYDFKDDTDTSTAVDSWFDNDLALSGGGYVASPDSAFGGFGFDFGGQYYGINDNPSGLPSGDVAKSLCFAFSSTDLTSTYNVLGGFGNDSIGESFQLQVGDNDNWWVLGFGDDWDTGIPTAEDDGNTHTAIVTYDGSETIVWIDATSIASTTSFNWDTDPQKIVLSAEIDSTASTSGDREFNGAIYRHDAFNKSLSTSEVSNWDSTGNISG